MIPQNGLWALLSGTWHPVVSAAIAVSYLEVGHRVFHNGREIAFFDDKGTIVWLD